MLICIRIFLFISNESIKYNTTICSVKYSGLAIRRNTKIILELNANNVFRYLLGNHTNSLDEEEIIYAVRISEIAKYNIYRSVVMSRKLGSQLNSWGCLYNATKDLCDLWITKNLLIELTHNYGKIYSRPILVIEFVSVSFRSVYLCCICLCCACYLMCCIAVFMSTDMVNKDAHGRTLRLNHNGPEKPPSNT